MLAADEVGTFVLVWVKIGKVLGSVTQSHRGL